MELKRFFLPLIMVWFLVMGYLWIGTIPYNEAPDEYTHFDVAQFIARNKRFPVFGQDENMGVSEYDIPGVVLKYNASYSAMPPLAYLWQAGLISLWPFGEGSSYLAARFANLVLGLVSLCLSWLVAKEIFKKTYQRLTFALLANLTPQMLFTFSYVNSDGLLLALSWVLWWWLVRFLKRTIKLKESLLFGLTLGIAVLTRYNIAPLVLVTAGVFAWRLWNQKQAHNLVGVTVKVMAALGVSLAVGGWWYVRNLLLYQDILATRQFWKTYQMIYIPEGKETIISVLFQSDWLWRNWQSLWGVFGWNTILLPNFIYRILLVGFLMAILGLFLRKWPKFKKRLLILSGVVLGLAMIASLWQSVTYAFQPQGRYLFAAWPGLVLILIWGGWQWVSNDKKRLVSFLTITFLLSLDLYALLKILIPAYY